MPQQPAIFMQQKRLFTDRDKERSLFWDTFSAMNIPNETLKKNVLMYYGVGGMGKTALKDELLRLLQEQNYDQEANWGELDFVTPEFRTSTQGLAQMRNSLRKQMKFPHFDFAYSLWWQKVNPHLKLTPGIGFLEDADLVNDILQTIEDIPLLGQLSKGARGFDRLKQTTRDWWLQKSNPDLKQLNSLKPDQVAEHLSYFWAIDVEQWQEQHPEKTLVCLLDTYEALWTDKAKNEGQRFTTDQWVRTWVAHCPRVLWVILGRERLAWHERAPENDWNDRIAHQELSDFGPEDAREFLTKSGLTDRDLQNVLIHGAKGIPFYLQLQYETYQRILEKGETPTPSHFAQTPAEILERFLKYLNTEETKLLKTLAPARTFDLALFKTLGAEFHTSQHELDFNPLVQYSFVRKTENGYALHELMRQALMESEPTYTLKLHDFLLGHYQQSLEEVTHPDNLAPHHASTFSEAFYHHRNLVGTRQEGHDEMKAWFWTYWEIFDHAGYWTFLLPETEIMLLQCQQIGDRQGEGVTLNNISQIYDAKGNYDTALRYLQQSLDISQQIGDRHGEGVTLNNISQIYQVRGDYDTALRYLQQSLDISQQIGDRKGEGTTLNNISQIYDAKGDYDTALRYLRQALDIQQQIGDRKGEGTTLNNISQILAEQKKDTKTALVYAKQAFGIAQQIGYGEGIWKIGLWLVELQKRSGQTPSNEMVLAIMAAGKQIGAA
ncbi:MAG: tetratricopeptide repeat protein [Rhodothermia bacterium]|nr:tetratricopeptide repeat protein [Rhodothermia bacterium]